MIFFALLAAVASVLVIFGSYVNWIDKSEETKSRVKKQLKKLGSTAYMSLAIIAGLGASAANISQIVDFATSSAPLTRPDVLNLLMYVWNSFAYGFFGLVALGVWIKDILDKKKSAIEPNAKT
ncbi:hypothetical protein KV580_25620 [Pseudomonas chlororaphis]|nr:hypothetical protein [Pseudomonas chlororaphis]